MTDSVASSPLRNPQAPLGGRRYDLDWVRIGAFLLLIFYHVGMYYVTWDWHVKALHPSSTLEPLMLASSPWRLSLLFLVSGVASAYLLQRRPAGFLRARSSRLLVPLVFGMAVIVPPQSYLEVVEKVGYTGSYLDFLKLYFTAYHGFCRGHDCLTLPTWNHLWFVAYVWVYTVVLWAAVTLVPRLVPRLRLLAERCLAGVGVVLLPILYLAALRLTLAQWYPATHALVGDWYNHALYGATFLAGFALAGARAPWAAMERWRWIALGLSVLAWAFISAWYALPDSYVPPQPALVAGRVIYAALQWLPIVAVLGFAQRHLNQDSPVRAYLTTAVFPVYILHQTVIVVCAHALKPSHLHPAVEGLLLIAVTASGCLLGYELVRRVPLLRPLLGLALAAPGRPAAAADGVAAPAQALS
jgi:peptidoglycan/LPS O-acetylase OafA/YrhL